MWKEAALAGPISESIPVQSGPISESIPVQSGPISESIPVQSGPISESIPVQFYYCYLQRSPVLSRRCRAQDHATCIPDTRENRSTGQAVSLRQSSSYCSPRVTDVTAWSSRRRWWHARVGRVSILYRSECTQMLVSVEGGIGEDWFYWRCRPTNWYRMLWKVRTRARLTF